MKVQHIGLSRFRRARVLLASMLVGLLTTPAAIAGPEGGRVVRGDGNIVNPDAATTNINQFSRNMVVDWNSFNVGVNETVNFHQPSPDATALNQIWDQDASQILGSVNANGRIILVNPNGILFGRNASVDVGSLIASGLSIDTDEFMQGNWSFNAEGEAGGLVVNQGLLRAADGGSVSLFGGAVQNSGTIIANYGAINLAAGETVTIDFDGDGLLQFAVDGDVLENAHGVDSAVANTGELISRGGSILLSANAARDVFSQVVNNGGLVEAGDVETRGGRVFLTGSGGDVVNTGHIAANSRDADGGTVRLESDADTIVRDGSIDASSATASGGDIQVLGERVGLFGESTLDASGATGGGRINIGGAFQGGDALRAAEHTVVSSDTSIYADAGESGNGGRVIVWADGLTQFYGTISAQGGANGGDGGFAEVSGHDRLVFDGLVSLSAAHGDAGTLLLDPADIEICTFGGGNCTAETPATNEAGGDPFVYDGAAGSVSYLDTAVLESQLNTGGVNVIVTTTNGTGGNGDISVVDAFSWTTGVTLTLQADNNITISDTIGNNSTGSLVLDATNAVDISAAITLDGGSFTSSGITFNTTANITAANAGGNAIDLSGHSGAVTASAGTLNTTAGDVLIEADDDSVQTGGFTTIQGAIDALGTVAGSSTINVADGIYIEDLAIDVSNLALQGAGTGVSTIQGVSFDDQVNFPTYQDATNILIEANNVTIDGFTLETPNVPAGSYAALITLNGSDITISNNEFISHQGDAPPAGANPSTTNIMIQSVHASADPASTADGLTITGNTFTGDGMGYYGVYLNEQGAALAGDVTIDGNTFNGNIWRAVSTERSDVIISNNNINPGTDVIAAWGGSGIAVRNFSGTVIDNVVIDGNTVNSGGANGEFASDVLLGFADTDSLTDIVITNNTGNINVIGDVSEVDSAIAWDTVGTISLGANASIVSGSSDISLTATDLAIDATAAINAGAQDVIFGVATGTTIELGGAGGTFNLTDAELDTITADTLTIGAADAGAVTIAGAISPANAGNLVLQTGSTVTQTAASTITVGGLGIDAGGAVTLDEANDVDTFAADLSAAPAGTGLSFVDADGFSVGTVDTLTGITTSNGDVTLTATTGDISLDVDDGGATPSIAAGSGAVSLTASNGSILDGGVDADQDISTSGAVSLIAAGAGSVGAAGAGGDINIVGTGDISIDSANGAYASSDTVLTNLVLTLDAAGTAAVSISSGSTTIDIGEDGADNIQVNIVDNNGTAFDFDLTAVNGDIVLVDNAISDIGTGDVTLATAGAIVDAASGNASIITDGIVTLSAATVGTAGNYLNVSEATGGAGITLTPTVTGQAYIDSIGATTIDGTGLMLGGGHIRANSPLVINADATITGDTTFTAAADGAVAGDNLTITNDATLTLDNTGAAITLTLEAGDHVIFDNAANAAVNVSGIAGQQAHSVVVTADLEGGGADGVTGSVTQSNAGVTAIDNTGDNTLALTASAGTDIGAAATALSTNVDSLDLTATAGDVYVNEANDVTLNGVTAGGLIDIATTNGSIDIAGAVTATTTVDLVAGGAGSSITDTAGGNTVTGTTVALNADTDIGNLAGNAISTDADNLDLAATNGDVFISEADGVTLDGVTAGGAIDIAATSGSIDIAGAVTATTTVDLTAGGAGSSITDTAGGNTVTGTTVTLSADTDIGNLAGNAISTAADNLDLVASNGDVSVTDVDDVIIDTLSTAGDSQVTAGGALTDDANATISVAGNAAFNGSSITLGDSGTDTFNTGTLTFTSAGVVTITEDSAVVLANSSTANALDLTANGSITDSGDVNISGGTATFTAGAANDIVLDSATNDFGTVVVVSGNNVTLRDANGITLDAITASGALDVGAVAGVTVNGAVVANGASSINTDNNNDGTGILTVTGTGSLDTTDNTLDIVAADVALIGTLDSGTAAMTITASNDGNLGVGTGAGALVLDDTELANITAAGLTLATTGAGAINLAGTTAGNTGSFGALTLNGAGGVNVTGNTTFANDVEFTGGTTDIGANVTSTTGGLDFSSAVTVSADAVVTAATVLNFDSTIIGGGTENFDLAGDTITLAGNASNLATFDANGTTGITVAGVATSGAQSYTGATSLNGNISSTSGDIVFNDDVTIGANLSVTTGGSITLAGVDASTNTASFRVDDDNNSAETLTVNGTFTTAGNISLVGGTDANDTLAGPNLANTWTISGANDGTLNGAGFTDFANLTGGTDDDTFQLVTGGSLTGTLDGGAETGADVLDVSGIADETIFLSGSTDSINAFTDIEEFVGTTTTVLSGGTNWAINAQNAGTVDGITFSDMANIAGTAGADNFVFTGTGEITGSVDGLGGSDTIDLSGYASASTVTLSGLGGTDGFAGNETVIAAFDNIDAIIGATGQANTLAGINAAASWSITGADDGTYTSTNSLNWTDFANLTGGTNADAFTLSGGSVTGTIDGGTGTDTLTADNVANTWNITGNNAGDVTGVNAFTDIENLAGGSNTDDFVFSDGITVSGTVDGNGGNDTLDVSAYTTATDVTLTTLGTTDGFDGTAAGSAFADINAVIGATGQANTLAGINAAASWSITSADDGTYTSTNSLNWTDFANLTGGTNTDAFTLSGGSITGTIDGGTGTDTLTADNVANTWNITGNNAGNVTGVAAFTSIENLTGGANDDTFAFIGTGSVSGTVTGGGQATADMLDYSGYTGGAVSVNLANATATATGGISGIEALIGSGNTGDTLIGANDANAWTIAGTDNGDVDGFSFDAIENLTGGSNVDTFDLAFNVTGTVTGGAGNDVFNVTDGVTIGTLAGGTGTDTLVGDNVANTWTISAAGSGDLNGQAFSQMQNLTGGSNDDTFAFTGTGSVAGTVTGGAQSTADTLDYSGYTGGPVTVDLANSTATATGGFAGIETLTGSGSTGDTLIGDNIANTWAVNADNAGDVNGFAFAAIENLTGGTNTDQFDLTAGVTGTISGGAGTDTIDVLGSFTGPGTQLTLDAETVSNTGGGVITVNTLNIIGATNVGAAGTELDTSVNNLALDAAGNVFIVETSALNISGSVGNNLVLAAGGAITQGASLTVGATADLQNSTGNITLNNAGNNFGTVLVSSVGDVTLRDATGIDLGTSGVAGDLTVTAGGNVTDSGSLAVGGATTVTATGSNVMLDNANDFASVGVTANNATINDVNALTLVDTTLTGNLVVSAGELTLAGQLDVNTLDLGAVPGVLQIDGMAGISTANSDIDLTNFSGIDASTSGSLALNAGSADILVPTIGATSALNGFSATAAQINLDDVTTNGAQDYTGTLVLNGQLDSGGAISVSGPISLAGNSGISGTTVDIDGAIDGNRALTLSGDVTVSGDIGATTALQSLTTTGSAIELEGSVTTNGAQTYGSAVIANANLTGGSLVFNDSVHFPNGAIVISDTIDFNGGNASVSGDDQLTLLPATADGTIDIGGNSGDLNISGAALNGYMGGLVIGGTYAPDQDHAVTNVARNIVVSDGIDTGAGTLALISTHGISLHNGTLSGAQLILIASDPSGTILNPGGNQTQLISNEIVLVSGSAIGQQGQEIRARSESGTGVLQIASSAEESAISDPANSLQQLIGREAPLAFAIASQFGFTINDNLLVTNSAQSSANREQGGGLTDEGFIDPSLFEDISLYEVLGTGIALPADQSEEGYFEEEDDCDPDNEDCDNGMGIGFVMPQ